ncbi:translocation/assembly module TamB domain-containing protein [Maribacter sp. MAR_2009_72]|uniref:translocation/assembly module TamB domain-containing protein n=1 Tax=Maribacter sp. MAR_2009_72 TaxID=1250050 RepID=UPI00119AB9B1|nr:translocation/assembly module TamB domain-containing protein [Maribacter sp. MAR_2009_72]TVZ16634.1 uncharacterized protein DUF490 [Maribacter sp. MAR_2009_72]
MTKSKNKILTYLKRFGKILLGLLVLFFILVLVIRTPWAQNLIVSKITDYVSGKTNTTVKVDKLYLTFSGNLQAEGIYLEDTKGDTLLYSSSLEANVPISPILFNNQLSIDNIHSSGVVAHIKREKNTEAYNFSFLIDAFATPVDSTKTTTSPPMEISIGDASLTNWNLTYNDAYLGTEIKLALGRLLIDISEFNLDEMIFSLDDFSLDNTQVTYLQSQPFPETNDTTITTLPHIRANDFNVKNLNINYSSIPDGLKAQIDLGTLTLTDMLANVANSQYESNNVVLYESQVQLDITTAQNNQSIESIEEGFQWPAIILDVQNIDLKQNTFTYNLNNTPRRTNSFDPNAFEIQRLNFKGSDFKYQKEQFNLEVEQFSLYEPSGIRLDQLAFKAGLTDTNAELRNINLQLNQSSANATMNVQFASLAKVFENPRNSVLSATISDLILELDDVKHFAPALAQNPYIDSLSVQPIIGSLNAQGNLKKVDSFMTDLRWGPHTNLTASGSVSNLTVPDSLLYNLNDITLKSTDKDLNKFISSKETGISTPNTLLVTGSLSGGMDWINPNLDLTIPEGSAHVSAKINFGNMLRFNGNVAIDSLQLNQLLKNEQLGKLSVTLSAKGSGSELSNINAEVKGTVSQFQFSGYSYENIGINGDMKNGNGTLTAKIKDPNLDMDITSVLKLATERQQVSFSSTIIGADLQELGLTRNNIKIAANINGDYSGIPTNFNFNTTIDNGIAIADNEQYQVATIYLQGHIEDTITDVSIKSGFINGALSSNASPNRITTALKKQLEHYFSQDSTAYTAEDSIEAKLNLAVIPTPILSKVFLNEIQELDSLNIDASFNSRKQLISAQANIPHLSYAGSSVDSLNAYVKGDSLDLKFSAGIADLLYEPIHLKQTYVEGSLKNKELLLDFVSKNDSVQVIHIASALIFKKDTLTLRIDPTDLILNKKPWEIPEDNRIMLAENHTQFQNIILNRNGQKLEVTNAIPNVEKEHIGILFQNFQLQTFLSLFNPDEALAKGKIEGDFMIINPYAASGLVADINIMDFQVLQNPLGTLTLDASSISLSQYDFNMALTDGGAELKLSGDYTAREQTADLNLKLDIKRLEAAVIQGFSKEFFSNPKGYLSGNMLVGGTLSEPKYSGSLNFHEFGLNLAAYNTALQINDQSLNLDQDNISFDNFTLTDANEGALSLNGKVLTKNLLNPGFDLNLKTERFRILDSKKGDDELVYGIASIKADVNVTGNLEMPVIDGKVRIRDITDLTYVVPQNQLDIQERDGVVIFVNRENPDAILTRNDGEAASSFFAGMDISTTLEIGNEATFTIVLDEKTQDKLQASGDATLKLNIDPNQDIRLSGRLELNSGFYRTSLYNLVSREFQLQQGSSIVWSGDPYDAKMDVTAIYEIETSAAPLMSAISYGQDTGVSSKYQQSAPFLVYLNIDGQLIEPELSFGLDMPENAQGNFGGAVYGRIQQLNEQESELNKQVFSLLALNRFYPTTGSDGSNGGAITIARNNVNKVLSSELNSISNKLLGNTGFELGFDLDSFQDYETGSAQNRTQLNINASKKLFDDRLIVTAGSAVDVEGSAASSDTATPIIGNVTLEYLLSEEGTYRLKGFRRQEYQNIIDGQLIVTGVAFIFDREFNKFSQLFSPLKKDDKSKKDTTNKNVKN